MQTNSNPKPKAIEINLVKEVWMFMQTVDRISQRELVQKISALTGKSHTASFYLVQLLCKPIQTGWKLVEGSPVVDFIEEPLLVEVPSLDRQKHYSLIPYWNRLTSDDSIFEKTRRFY